MGAKATLSPLVFAFVFDVFWPSSPGRNGRAGMPPYPVKTALPAHVKHSFFDAAQHPYKAARTAVAKRETSLDSLLDS